MNTAIAIAEVGTKADPFVLMDASKWVRRLVFGVFSFRISPSPLHRALAWEFQARRLGLNELKRILYYQPMFEALCERVGSEVRMEICPDSVFPALTNVRLTLGNRVRFSARATFSGARNAPQKPFIEVGDDTYLGHRCVFRAGTSISIGKRVLIASNALLSGDPGHPLDPVARRTQPAPTESLGRIEIGDDAWLAYNVSVIGNVKIGEGAVIAANSVVTKDVPPFALMAGNPARMLRSIGREEQPVNELQLNQKETAGVREQLFVSPVTGTVPPA